ncbi:hypothetical protein L6452_17155 [Arctium lappa]|uniref:Uncharacterized protein n=1 Tax=Arctium lappa TaxID=4217 RepID=A0ACB9C2N9_ARCLA|nr:hypothetical protein L6452_17155 [Arctium lappa]
MSSRMVARRLGSKLSPMFSSVATLRSHATSFGRSTFLSCCLIFFLVWDSANNCSTTVSSSISIIQVTSVKSVCDISTDSVTSDKFHCPIVNVDKLWSMVPHDAKENASVAKVPIVDVTQFSYFKELGKGMVPQLQPMVVKAKLVFFNTICNICVQQYAMSLNAFQQLSSVAGVAKSHGMETMGPPPKNKSYDKKYHQRSFDNEILSELAERTKNIQGVMIEDNKFFLSVHYRHVKDEVYVCIMHQFIIIAIY